MKKKINTTELGSILDNDDHLVQFLFDIKSNCKIIRRPSNSSIQFTELKLGWGDLFENSNSKTKYSISIEELDNHSKKYFKKGKLVGSCRVDLPAGEKKSSKSVFSDWENGNEVSIKLLYESDRLTNFINSIEGNGSDFLNELSFIITLSKKQLKIKQKNIAISDYLFVFGIEKNTLLDD